MIGPPNDRSPRWSVPPTIGPTDGRSHRWSVPPTIGPTDVFRFFEGRSRTRFAPRELAVSPRWTASARGCGAFKRGQSYSGGLMATTLHVAERSDSTLIENL